MRLNLSADDVLTTTRAVRKRLDLERPVEREVLEECLQIALQAPTRSNTQAWHWLMVTDPAHKQSLAEIYRRNAAQYPGAPPTHAAPGGGPSAAVAGSAAHLVANMHRVPVIMIPCIGEVLDGLPTAMAASRWGSILPAVWSFMLAARERGLGSCWTTIHLLYGGEHEAAEILGIPDGYTQAGLFPVAYTIGTDFKPAARLPLEPILHWDQW